MDYTVHVRPAVAIGNLTTGTLFCLAPDKPHELYVVVEQLEHHTEVLSVTGPLTAALVNAIIREIDVYPATLRAKTPAF